MPGDFLTDLGAFDFLRSALLTGLLVSVACGVIGTYVVTRRITYIAGAISHSVLGGMGAALYLRKAHGLEFCSPLLGAVAAALVSALVIGFVSLRAKEREDTVIGAIWAVGMALGIVFISRTPGYNEELMSYLFGNILMVSDRELWLIAGLDVVVVGLSLAFYNAFLAVCFDEEFARLRGLKTEAYYLLLLCLAALTVVLLVTVVGVVMVIALLTLPVATAAIFGKNLWQIMILAAGLSALYSTVGLAASYAPNLPAGATVILIAAAAYLVSLAGRRILRPGRRALAGASQT